MIIKNTAMILLLTLVLTSCGLSEDADTASSYVTSETQTVTSTVNTETTAVTSYTTADDTTLVTESETATETAAEVTEFPDEVLIDTGTFNQYQCSLAGSTACGATAGTLLLQTLSYVTSDELIERMDTIRNYSALGDDYSCGAPQYYLAGYQISNCLNKYLEDNGFDGYHLTNHRTDRSTEETLIQLLATGRPAVLEVCYANGTMLSDFQGYSHWICVNGYRITDEGVQFRYSDTIADTQMWVDSDLLDISNANVSYGNFYLQPEMYIVSFDTPI